MVFLYEKQQTDYMLNLQTHTLISRIGHLTPTNAQVDFEVVPLREHSNDQQVVEVDAFHQQPVAVGHDAVLHHHQGSATANCGLQESRGKFHKTAHAFPAERGQIGAAADGISLWQRDSGVVPKAIGFYESSQPCHTAQHTMGSTVFLL